MVVGGRVAGHRVCAQTWMSEDPLPGRRTSSTPGTAVGAVAEWPWPASPGCPPPAGAPGPGCPFPRCAAAVAASSPARAASAAQPSDWTSRQRETSSANTHSEQPCRHDNLSIPRPIPATKTLHPKHPNVQSPKKLVNGKTVGKKVSVLLRAEYCELLRCRPPIFHANCIDTEFPTSFSQISPFSNVLYAANKRTVCIWSYGRMSAGFSHLAAVAFQCPMLCADSMRKISLCVDDNDHYTLRECIMGGRAKGYWEETKIFFLTKCFAINIQETSAGVAQCGTKRSTFNGTETYQVFQI